MPYWEMVMRSFHIAWGHKYLWLLALFSGEAAGGFSFSYSQSSGSRGNPNVGTFMQQVAGWLNAHAGLILGGFVLILLLGVALFVLAAACEGALIRASAEHDAERPFGLGPAWQAGRATMTGVLGLRLMIIGLAVPVVVLLIAVVLAAVVAIAGSHAGAGIALVLIALLLFLAAVPYVIYLTFLDRLGTRAVVLEQLRAAAAIRRGHRLVFGRMGRVLLVWLISIATGIVVGIATGLGTLLLLLPAIVLAVYALTGAGTGFFVAAAIAFVIALPFLWTVAGFVAAQSSTYWTLAFRRLEIDRPAYQYPQPAYPPNPQLT